MKNIYTYFDNNKNFSLLAFDAIEVVEWDQKVDFKELESFLQRYSNTYRFGFLSYDVNQENQENTKPNRIGFPKGGFFVPRYVVQFDESKNPTFLKGDKNKIALDFINDFFSHQEMKVQNDIDLVPALNKTSYIKKISALQNEMVKGKLNAIVYCQDFYANHCKLEALSTYFELNRKTKAPFSCFVQWEEKQLLSASPERFLKKEGRKLITQPIKGTAKRGNTKAEDQELKDQLLSSEKEKEENSMIAHLAQEELSRLAKKENVQIDELSGIYTFETVHQLISTVSAVIDEDISFSTIIKTLFPMGSMTGAPKDEALELINRYENFYRGLYSGSVGYFKPNGDFDFNVVIRSILYNDINKKISCPVGGGITLKSNPESEFEECLIKVKALKEVLEKSE